MPAKPTITEEEYLHMRIVRALIPRGATLPENLREPLWTIEHRLGKGCMYTVNSWPGNVSTDFQPRQLYDELINKYEAYHANTE